VTTDPGGSRSSRRSDARIPPMSALIRRLGFFTGKYARGAWSCHPPIFAKETTSMKRLFRWRRWLCNWRFDRITTVGSVMLVIIGVLRAPIAGTLEVGLLAGVSAPPEQAPGPPGARRRTGVGSVRETGRGRRTPSAPRRLPRPALAPRPPRSRVPAPRASAPAASSGRRRPGPSAACGGRPSMRRCSARLARRAAPAAAAARRAPARRRPPPRPGGTWNGSRGAPGTADHQVSSQACAAGLRPGEIARRDPAAFPRSRRSIGASGRSWTGCDATGGSGHCGRAPPDRAARAATTAMGWSAPAGTSDGEQAAMGRGRGRAAAASGPDVG
jgi:hypothetical protein